jgi:serine phosphatase RsbU (regulator of sigma subunit)
MRLVRDSFPAAMKPADDAAQAAAIAPLEQHVDRLQRELDAVQKEVADLRLRDETLKFYMHRLDEELRLAARLQQDFLPKALPQLGDIRFHTLYRPAGYVSGDLYDVMRLDEFHVGFYMADAVGHGMPAALLTMFLKNALATKEINKAGYRLLPPSETMARLNTALVEQNLSQATFATAVYGVIDVRTLELTFARGGHPCPVLMHADGQLDVLPADGSLLGIFPDEAFAQTTVQLTRGDRLFIFSDGIEVAFAGDQTMDTQQWREALHSRRQLSSAEMIAGFAEQLDKEAKGKFPKDDLTMIVVDVADQPKA